MKAIILSIFTIVAISVQAQTEVDFLNALGKKDLTQVGTLLAPTVSFCIKDDQMKIPKEEAVKKLKIWLKGKTIQNFKILHNGKSSDSASSYRVARIKTDAGTFRIFAYSEGVGAAGKVIEIRIDPM